MSSKKRYEDLGFAKLDFSRASRTGYHEVIFGEGKSIKQAGDIFARLAKDNETVILTRANPEMGDYVLSLCPDAVYHPTARIAEKHNRAKSPVGFVAVATGGTADEPVAEEAAVVLEAFGSRVERFYDIGVAGVHRIFDNLDGLKKANCIIAVAGMEGALPSVIGGLVSVPLIAVPTSVGYGANLGGVTTLLSMLCSCAAGVSVVNIDNGFGAAYQADMINKMVAKSGGKLRI
ncbi:MAG: nickel pincer cofactor biosynthesis protein LarB [Deferribacteraceae bacterium]|jgi:NCAIR mutase (PurE)-related protein|nr:nickel pincer cofactor biosynthesis protein LarB [Deferribacteraceae bacterium]